MNEIIKSKIIDLLISTERPGIKNLINYMENESDFFTAPCSGQYHGCRPGGLAEHSLNVYQFGNSNLGGLIEADYTHPINWIIVSILHDLGKSTYRNKPNYIPNILKSGKQSEDKPYTTNSDRLYISHEVISLQILNKYIELTEEEEFAIFYHNGLYVASGRDVQGKERPLQLLLHFSDMWASRFIENE